jgi:hypothetical protein
MTMSEALCNNPSGCRWIIENPNKQANFDQIQADTLLAGYVEASDVEELDSCTQMCAWIVALSDAAKVVIEEEGVPIAAVRVNESGKPTYGVAYQTEDGTFSKKVI